MNNLTLDRASGMQLSPEDTVRRRVSAELVIVKNVLNQSNLRERTPQQLLQWYRIFSPAIRGPNIQDFFSRSIQGLEEILSDHANRENSPQPLIQNISDVKTRFQSIFDSIRVPGAEVHSQRGLGIIRSGRIVLEAGEEVKDEEVKEREVTGEFEQRQILPLTASDLIRRRLPAELFEIQQELAKWDSRAPIMSCFIDWFERFNELSRDPNLQEIVPFFVRQLETILEDPLNPNNPYPPKLFGPSASPPVRFMIAKMRNVNSVLFSDRISQAAAASIPQRPRDLSAQLKMIREMQLRREREEESHMRELQQVKVSLLQDLESGRGQLLAISNEFHATMEQKIKEAKELEVIKAAEVANLQMAVARLRNEVRESSERAVRLQENLNRMEGDLDALQRGNAVLEIEVTRLEAAMKEKKENWLNSVISIAASIAITWALQSVLPGSNVNLLGKSILLPM